MKAIDHLFELTGWFKTSASTSEDRPCLELESIRRDFKGAADPFHDLAVALMFRMDINHA
jgi:hypothetical protein